MQFFHGHVSFGPKESNVTHVKMSASTAVKAFYRVVHKTDPIGSFSLYNKHRSVHPGRWSWVLFPAESAEHQIWNTWSKFRCILCLIRCCRLGQLFVSLHFLQQMLQKMSALSFKEFKHTWEHFQHVADVCKLTDWRLIGLKFVT